MENQFGKMDLSMKDLGMRVTIKVISSMEMEHLLMIMEMFILEIS